MVFAALAAVVWVATAATAERSVFLDESGMSFSVLIWQEMEGKKLLSSRKELGDCRNLRRNQCERKHF